MLNRWRAPLDLDARMALPLVRELQPAVVSDLDRFRAQSRRKVCNSWSIHSACILPDETFGSGGLSAVQHYFATSTTFGARA